MAYAIEIVASALDELKKIKAFYRQQIRDAIRQQLANQPTVETRNRKPLSGAKPDFEHIPPALATSRAAISGILRCE
jgi:mRNA-degrading endonuclease RelE of RelBE toxin-antitoxin system